VRILEKKSCLPWRKVVRASLFGGWLARESSLRISHTNMGGDPPTAIVSPAWPTCGSGGYVRERVSKPNTKQQLVRGSLSRRLAESARESSLRISLRKTNGQLPSTTISPAWLTCGPGGYVRETGSLAAARRLRGPTSRALIGGSQISARESSLRISLRKTNGRLPSTKILPAWPTSGSGGYVRERSDKLTRARWNLLLGGGAGRLPPVTPPAGDVKYLATDSIS
jgi:hypothetical protein